jgi:D-alanyl-D-alanine carboxypeptidase
MDSAFVDPSTDLYGGGGIAATVGDLGRFMRALFTGGVYSNPDTARTMLTTVDSAQRTSEGEVSSLPPGMYRMGVWVAETDGVTVYRHSGFWGTAADYVPELDLAVAASIHQNQAKPVLWEMMRRSIVAVRDAAGPSPAS